MLLFFAAPGDVVEEHVACGHGHGVPAVEFAACCLFNQGDVGRQYVGSKAYGCVAVQGGVAVGEAAYDVVGVDEISEQFKTSYVDYLGRGGV